MAKQPAKRKGENTRRKPAKKPVERLGATATRAIAIKGYGAEPEVGCVLDETGYSRALYPHGKPNQKRPSKQRFHG